MAENPMPERRHREERPEREFPGGPDHEQEPEKEKNQPGQQGDDDAGWRRHDPARREPSRIQDRERRVPRESPKRRREDAMRALMSILLAGLIAAPAIASEPQEAKRLREAEEVLKMSVNAPDGGIPRELLERAECVGVFPGVKKGAFVVGGEFGRGVFTCRQENGKLGAPAFFSMGGGSFGWQFGGQEVDLVMLIMNDQGVRHLLKDKFTLGGEVSAAAGPVGRTAEAATDAQLHAQILSWSRSRGLFVGASLEGTVVAPSKEAIVRFYGKPVAAREILVDRNVKVPRAARSFVETTTQHARRS